MCSGSGRRRTGVTQIHVRGTAACRNHFRSWGTGAVPCHGVRLHFLVSTGIAIVRTEVFSPLLGWASIVVSVLVALLVHISLTFSSYHPGGWTVIGWVGFIGKLTVIIWMSLAMARQPKNADRTSAGARKGS